MIIFAIILLVIFLVAVIVLIYAFKKVPIKVGDVMIEKYYYDNPFMDKIMCYETVYDVRKGNNNNRWYFKSYTSDKFGHKAKYQSEFASEHENGRKFWFDDWVIVNHIEKPEVNKLQNDEPVIE